MNRVKKLMSGQFRELLLYGAIGGGAVAIDLGVFWILYKLGGGESASSLYIVIANVVAIFIAIVYSFTLNSIFTFKTRDHLFKRFISFTGVSMVGMAISTLMLIAATAVGVALTPAKIVSLPFIFIVQFTLNRLLTFRSSKREQPTLQTLVTEGDII